PCADLGLTRAATTPSIDPRFSTLHPRCFPSLRSASLCEKAALERHSQLGLEGARRNEVRAAECRKKVVKHVLVGQIGSSQTQDQAQFFGDQQVIGSHTKAQGMEMCNRGRIVFIVGSLIS